MNLNLSKNLKRLSRTIPLLFILLVCMASTYANQGFIKETVFVTMEDGIKLATDVFKPAEEEGPFPVILIRTPYGKHQHAYEGEFWASEGFVVVIQDARGKWDSEGDFIPFLHEKTDGLETVNWITEQSWSNREIGLWGSSYLSYCANVIATAGHSSVKTMFVISGWLQGDKIINPGGAMHLMLNLAWILHEETQRVRSLQKYDLEELFEYLPLIDVFNSIGIDSKIWTRTLDIRSLNDSLSAEQINIPVFHMSGWNDFVCNAALDVYHKSSTAGPAKHKLMVGPWFHDQLQTEFTEVGDEDFGPESIMGRAKMNMLALQWFNHILKETDPELETGQDVSVFVMGENKWRNFDQWPPAKVNYLQWYLSSAGGANGSAGDGRLSRENNRSSGMDTFIYDPMNPVPTYGGANFHFFLHTIGIKDQSDIEERKDVLVYTSEVLKDTLTILGNIKVRIHASSDCPDTDFTAKFVEHRKDGYARIIQDGIIRASHRNTNTQRELLDPGEIYELEIDLGETAISIPGGSRLTLEISSSNFPKYDRNPNSGEDAFTAEKLNTARQKVYHGEIHPSYVLLPVLSREGYTNK